MKVKHVFIFICYASYFLALFLIYHFGIDVGFDGGVIMGLIGATLLLWAVVAILDWVGKNWNRDIIDFIEKENNENNPNKAT